MSYDNTVPINDFNEDIESTLNVGLEDDDIEDFIPTSQPRSGQSMTSLQSITNKKIEETIPGEEFSTLEDTLPVLGDETFSDSIDYIPDTEMKLKRKLSDVHENNEPSCKKSLEGLDGTEVKFSEDIFSTQASKVPSSPSMIDSQLLSVINETATQSPNLFNLHESDADMSRDILVSDTSVTEIFDNDLSKGTITIDSRKNSAVLETQELVSPDGDKNDNSRNENDIIDIDSPLRFVETSASLPIFNSQQVEDELQKSDGKTSDGAMTNDTIDANGVDFPPLSPFPKRCDTDPITLSKLPSLSNGLSSEEVQKLTNSSSSGSRKNMFKNVSEELSSEVQKHSTPEIQSSKIFNTDESASSIENLTPLPAENTKKIEITFHLKIDCEIVFDSQFKEAISKKIINATDLEKSKLSRVFFEQSSGVSISSDDKSKGRLSSSSAGSVYSDKASLPFALPLSRLSAATRQTESSGSTDELDKAYKIRARKVWVNEYMVPMVLDEIFERRLPKIKDLDDSADSTKRKTPLSSQKPKSRRRMPQRTLSDVNESTNTEDFLSNPDIDLSDQSNGLTNKEKDSIQENLDSEVQEPEKNESKSSEHKTLETVPEEKSADEEESDANKDSLNENLVVNKTPEKETADSGSEEEAAELGSEEDSDSSDSGNLKIGTSVFARWTDLNYYSGALQEHPKADRWNVKFDDGSTKVIREDFILPLKWLKEGELVFALVNNSYDSGKITKVNRGKLKEFTVELDETNLEVSVNRIDIRLTETMATIVKEKYQPLNNVLAGKRNREFSTPTRSAALQTGSSRKKDSARKSTEKKTPAPNSTKKTETPSRSTGRGRKPKISDQNEPVKDPETPVRSSKGKAKSLAIEFEKSVTPAAAAPAVPEEPVPGPSNVKRGRGRPKLVTFELGKDEGSTKKMESKETNEKENKEEENIVPTETRKGKRKLRTTDVAESKPEKESVTAKKKGRNSKKK